MDLRTRYLGLELPHPLVCGASPLADELGGVRRLEDAGAAAIVLRSLFEEQLEQEQYATLHALEAPAESFAEALSYLPASSDFVLGPHEYLEHLRRVKEAVAVPVIASLNGTSLGGWLAHAREMEEAGADALELNVYQLATDPLVGARELEDRTAEMVEAVCDAAGVPVAIKLSPFYTALPEFAARLDRAGVAGLVIFNRFYQSDVDLEDLEVRPTLELSDSSELLLRLRWLAILRGKVAASLCATGGVHSAEDVLKAVVCGADAVQMVSELLRFGPQRLATIRRDMELWLEEHQVEALSDIVGTMSHERSADPAAFERAQYMRVLQSWRPPRGRATPQP